MTQIKKYNEFLLEHSDGRDDRIYVDENGDEWLKGEDGKIMTDEYGDKIPPTKTSKKEKTESGWDVYDTSQGHCAFCGRMGCREDCVK